MLSIVLLMILCLISIESINSQSLYLTSTGGVGAIYTMATALDINQILIFSVNAIGQLTMAGSISTNGSGIYSTSREVLPSQKTVVVYNNYLFVVNSGSHSLSMFLINTSDATQLTLISVQSSFGYFPMSIAVNDIYACVLSSGNISGIRCFTYNSSGMFLLSSFDRNLTSYIREDFILFTTLMTYGQISFSADNLALIVVEKHFPDPSEGYLLFYPLINSVLTSFPIRQRLSNTSFPVSMTLVKMNGILVTDPMIRGVITLNYSSTTGLISNSVVTPINDTRSGILFCSTYSPTIGNHYVIGGETGSIVELNLNLNSVLNPVTIVQYYQIDTRILITDPTVITVPPFDYLYVINPFAQQIISFQLNGPGNASINQRISTQSGNITTGHTLVGTAGYLQIQSLSTTTMTTSSNALSFSTSIIMIIISIFILFRLLINLLFSLSIDLSLPKYA